MFCHTFWKSCNVRQWWIREFHNSQPGTSLLPLRKPARVERACLFSHSDICGRAALPVPPAVLPSPLPPAPLRGGGMGYDWGTRPHHHTIARLWRGRAWSTAASSKLQKPRGRDVNTYPGHHLSHDRWGKRNGVPNRRSPGWREIPAKEELPQETPRLWCPRPWHQGRSSTRCPPSRGCQDRSLATPPAGASALESHQRPPATQSVREAGRPCGKQG